MTLSLNKPKLDNLADEIWKSAERLRGKFKAYEYQNVILPIIVIRRLECVLIKWREDKAAEVFARRPNLIDSELTKLVKDLETSNAPFFNKTAWTLRGVYEEDHALLEENFRAYINGFSRNVDDIIEHFNYRATIGQTVKNNRLAPILTQYKELELGPDKLSPLEMGYIYEELLRRFSEQSGEEAGEHVTPREGTRAMDVMKLAGKLAKVIDEKGLAVAAEDLLMFDGVGDAKAALLLAALEFARRRIKPEGTKIETPADLLPHVRHYADRKQEHCLGASINGANEIINIRVVSIGLIDRAPVHPREVCADALADRASAVIVAHNHPAGSVEPSSADVEATKQLKAAGAIMGMPLLDHIIFNRSGYFSFLEAGRL